MAASVLIVGQAIASISNVPWLPTTRRINASSAARVPALAVTRFARAEEKRGCSHAIAGATASGSRRLARSENKATPLSPPSETSAAVRSSGMRSVGGQMEVKSTAAEAGA